MEQLYSVQARHHDVGDHGGVVEASADHFQCFGAVARLPYPEASLAKNPRGEPPDAGVVVHHEHGLCGDLGLVKGRGGL